MVKMPILTILGAFQLRNAILITIDGWGTNLLGTYGNPLCQTPNLDRFAATSIVFDRAYIGSSDLFSVLHSISHGIHPAQSGCQTSESLATILQTMGKQSLFMTDDPKVAELPWVQAFNESFCFDPTEEVADEDTSGEGGSADWQQTRLSRFVEAALGELARYAEDEGGLPEWIWLHLSGLTIVWDAPYEYRRALCDDEDDPEPPSGSIPLQFEVSADTDPDAVFGAVCAASGQGKLIDQIWEWLETFLEAFIDHQNCLVIVAGTRGFPLGEHRSVGFVGDELYSELIHVPLIVQPGHLELGMRVDSLVELTSLWNTIVTWLAPEKEYWAMLTKECEKRPLSINLLNRVDDAGCQARPPTICLSLSAGCVALQTLSWSALWPTSCQAGESPAAAMELYLSPDDRWQQNNVVSRATEIAESMQGNREVLEKWILDGCPLDRLPPPPQDLPRPW